MLDGIGAMRKNQQLRSDDIQSSSRLKRRPSPGKTTRVSRLTGQPRTAAIRPKQRISARPATSPEQTEPSWAHAAITPHLVGTTDHASVASDPILAFDLSDDVQTEADATASESTEAAAEAAEAVEAVEAAEAVEAVEEEDTGTSPETANYLLDSLSDLVDGEAPRSEAILGKLQILNDVFPDVADLLLGETDRFLAILNALQAEQGPAGVVSALVYLQMGSGQSSVRTLAAAARLLDQLGAWSEEAWATLVQARPADQVLGAVTDPVAFAALSSLSGDPVALLGRLPADPAALGEAMAQAEFRSWVAANGGDQALSSLEQRVQGYADTVQSLVAAHGDQWWNAPTFREQLDSLPSHPSIDANTAETLRNYLYAIPEGDYFEIWAILFDKRFDAQLRDSDKTQLYRGGVIRMWELLETMPAAHSEAVGDIRRLGESGMSFAKAAHIFLYWDEQGLGETRQDRRSDDEHEAMTFNAFDHTFRHEVGHTVGGRYNLDTEGGFVYETIGWRFYEFATLETELRNILAADFAGHPELDTMVAAIMSEPASEADYENALGTELWNEVKDRGPFPQLLGFIGSSRPWNDPIQHGENRYFPDLTDPLGNGYFSVPTTEYNTRVTDYSMKSPKEWFAEVYATYYASLDQPGTELGHLVQERHLQAYELFTDLVHRRGNLANETGQSSARDNNGSGNESDSSS